MPAVHLDEGERLDRKDLERLQLRRLQETVARVYERVPHYRAKLDSAGVAPDSIHSLDDRGVNLFPTQIEELVLATPALSPHFVLELTTKGRLDALSVKVEQKPGVSDRDSERGRKSLQEAIRGRIGVSTDVTLELAGSLPRSEGR